VLPGGLTRVAPPEGELVVNSPQVSGGLERYLGRGESPLQVSRHSIQGLVADQATSTEAIPIINSAVHHIDQAPATACSARGRSSSNRVVQLVE
jgi:hypothetical protein